MNEILININEIISILPVLIIYILPGYISIIVKNHLLDKRNEDNKQLVVNSIFISYILINFEMIIIRLFNNVFKIERDLLDINFIIGNSIFIIITISIGIFLGFLIYKVRMSENWVRLNQKVGINRTLFNNIWDDVISPHNGPNIRVYLPNENIIYDGKLKVYERNNNDNYFIAISNYQSYDNRKKKILENRRDDDRGLVVINTKDISRYELFY